MASAVACAWRRILFNPFSRTTLAEGLAETSLARRAVLVFLLDGFSKLSWEGVFLIIFRILS